MDDVAAWFVYLTKQCPHLPCLKQLGVEGERMARAEALIVEETLRNPLHLRFWDRELALTINNPLLIVYKKWYTMHFLERTIEL